MAGGMKRGMAFVIVLAASLFPASWAGAAPIGTAFPFEDAIAKTEAKLKSPLDMQFSLWDAATGGSQIGSTQTVSPVILDKTGGFTVSLDFGVDALDGNLRWIQIGARTVGIGTYTVLSRRRPIMVAPYSLYSVEAEDADTVDGLHVSDLALVNHNHDGAYWKLTGNAGTTPGTNFVGTTDDQALDLKVNGARIVRYEPRPETPNIIGGNGANWVTSGVDGAVIAGGGTPTAANRVTDYCGTIGGGAINQAGDGAGTTEDRAYATVGGGAGNAAGGNSSTVGGGSNNTASGNFSMVPGGQSNVASGLYGLAAGRRAKAYNDGAFVWADSTDLNFASTAANEFSVRCVGGARFVSAVDGGGFPSAGVTLAAGAGSWSSISDRAAKDNFRPVDGADVLARLARIPVLTWNMKTQDPAIRHIGPMAQDMYAQFGVGEDEKRINTVDADGIALAAIQGLYKLVQQKDAELTGLRAENADIKARLLAIEAALAGHAKP